MSHRSSKNILVTGGAGFIGSAFVRNLLKSEKLLKKMVNLDLLTYAGSLGNLKEVENDPRHIFVRGDILNSALVEELIRTHEIDTIVHFAAESHVDHSIQDPTLFYKTNVEGTIALLEVVRRFPKIHFHHVSTDEVYGSIDEGEFTENSPYQPNSPYAASKAASDHFVRSYHITYGLSVTLSHCGNNFGPYQHSEKFVPKMIEGCIKKEALTVYGKGDNVRNWIYVDDHVDALWKIVLFGENGHNYNIGAKGELSNLELLQLLIERMAHKKKKSPEEYATLITHVKDRPGHDFRYALSSQKLQTTLGWEPKNLLQDGVDKTIDWYMNKCELFV